MMMFLHPVSFFTTTGKTAKGKALQEMALKFDRSLIHGDSTAMSQLVVRMREIVAVLDAKYPRTRPTSVYLFTDRLGCGQIYASPMAADGHRVLDQEYFRITFNTVAHTATIDEVLDNFTLAAIEKGGEA